MNWIKQTLAALSCVLLMVSCEYEFIEIPTPAPPNPEDTISFSAEIVPIFSDQGCNVSNCHGGIKEPDLRAENAHESIHNGFVVPFEPDQSTIFTKPAPDGTHYGKYTAEQSALVQQWIEQGALDN